MVAQLQREDGPATATPDERTHMRIEQLEQRADASHVAPPVFSVVAPVYNEEETLPHFYRRVVDARCIPDLRRPVVGERRHRAHLCAVPAQS